MEEDKLTNDEKEMRSYSDDFVLHSVKYYGSAFSLNYHERLAIHGQHASYLKEAKRRNLMP